MSNVQTDSNLTKFRFWSTFYMNWGKLVDLFKKNSKNIIRFYIAEEKNGFCHPKSKFGRYSKWQILVI